MRWWKLALGILIVLAIGIWDIGLPGRHAQSTGQPGSSFGTATTINPIPAVPSSPIVPNIPGVIHPQGAPEFTATFSGSRLDTSVWSTCYPSQASTGCTNFGNAKTEAEWYLPSQVQIYGGLLHLVAQRETTAGKTSTGSPKTYSCRSGMITSYPGFQFQYGYIQVVAQIPTGLGLWPALWMAPANLTWPPEMDMLEAWGQEHFFASTYFHFATPAGLGTVKAHIDPPSHAIGWHTFALSWTHSQLTFIVDGKALLTTHQHIPHEKMYFIADLAEWVSKSNPSVTPNECNGSMLIRSVQVWPL